MKFREKIPEIVLATRNEGKVREFQKLLGSFIDRVLYLKDFEDIPEIVEDGETFRENALKKARVVTEYTGRAVIADDSGLEVDALGGSPGVYSARYAGEGATDRENIDKLLGEMSGVENRKANFVCYLALVLPGGEEHVVSGKCFGEITKAPRGEGGFGYDPVFFVPSKNRTMAELSPEVKNSISHRANAMRALAELFDNI